MLAALSLMVLTLYFLNKQKPILPLVIPMIFVTIITIYSLLLKVESFYLQGNMLLLTISLFLLTLIGWMLFEGCKLFFKIKAKI
jgi:carbon starvation protein